MIVHVSIALSDSQSTLVCLHQKDRRGFVVKFNVVANKVSAGLKNHFLCSRLPSAGGYW